MARRTPPALVRAALATALSAMLASCGGGSIGAPVATTTAVAPAPASTAAASPPARPPAAPRTTATVRARAPAAASRRAGPTGGAAPPEQQPHRSSSAAAGRPAVRKPAASTPKPTTSPIDERAQLVLTRRISPAHYFQQGTVTGTYDGTMEIEARITSQGVLVRFTATLPGGTIEGHGVAVAILDSTTWPALRGTAVVTGGTGRFAHVRGRGLKVNGRARPDASRARVRLTGTVSGL
ncbi:MAG: hypothetical protein JSS99_08665 [Actinobacteria bacterium]|nr:hypothetical protein [Actinomycetota bacterium]